MHRVCLKERKILDRIFKEDAQPLEQLVEKLGGGVPPEDLLFGVAGLYGRVRGSPSLEEIFHAFDGILYYVELPELTLLLLTPDADSRDLAGKVALWLRCRGAALNVAYLEGRRGLPEARQIRDMFLAAADEAFYCPAAECRPLVELLPSRREAELGDPEDQRLRLLRRDIASCLARGEADFAHERLENYFAISGRGSAAVFREYCASLYHQVNEDLVAPDEKLAGRRRALRSNGKSVFQLVAESNNAGEVRRHITWYVDQLLDWYRPMKENTNYRVAAFVEEYIEKHYMETVSIDEVASQVGLSTNYVRTIFKNSRGTTIQNYLSEYRLNMACKLLRNTPSTVSRVGQMVGYNNVSYFCASFQKRFGKTPTAWRREL